MISKEDFLQEASKAYDEWRAQNPDSKNAYDYEKDFESWFLKFGRKILEDRTQESVQLNRNQKKKS